MVMGYNPCNMNYPYTLYYGCNSVSLSMLNLMNQANFCNALSRSIDANVQQCHNSVASQNLKTQMEAQTQQVLDFSKNIDNCPATAINMMYRIGVISMKEERDYLSSKYVTSFDSTFYADNKPIASLDSLQKPKKHYTIYDLDKFIFPEDPIRDWVERKVAEINKKYAWIDQLDI